MNKHFIAPVVVVAVAAAGLGGYWLGHGNAPAERATTDARGRLLYYRNPMGEADTSPVPKKDSMGMDYIPVYEHEAPAAAANAAPGTVTIDPAKIQRAGVRLAPVVRRTVAQDITAAGTVRFNDAAVTVVAPRVEGWVERVHVGAIGVAVKAGQPLADIYSPELVQTQEEYVLARGAGADGLGALADGALANAALARLRVLGLPESQVRALAAGAAPRRTITLTAPVPGVVAAKTAAAGLKFMPGDVLYRLADPARVWVVAKVFERDLAALRLGAPAAIAVQALPGQAFAGTVGFIAPALDPETRTADVRIDVANPDGALRADMFATVRFTLGDGAAVLAVPGSAIIDSGTRRVVLVARDGGRFEPRDVTTGARSGDDVAVTAGLAENEQVVVDAAFLIDAESNLKAALQSFTPPGAPPVAPPGAPEGAKP